MFAKLLPHDGDFFKLFNQHAECIVKTAQALSMLVANYDNPQLREQYTREVDDAEHAADRITHEVNRALHKTFITPIDREQIHSLINTMDDVADLVQDAAESMSLYDVKRMTDEILRLTELSLKCCERLRDAVLLIGDVAKPATAEAATVIGLARWVRTPGPWRFSKLRLVELITRRAPPKLSPPL